MSLVEMQIRSAMLYLRRFLKTKMRINIVFNYITAQNVVNGIKIRCVIDMSMFITEMLRVKYRCTKVLICR